MKNHLINRTLVRLVVILIIAASVKLSPVVAADESKWPIGDEWLYSYKDDYPGETYTGYMRYFCVGKTTWHSRDNSIDVIEFRSNITGNISGEYFRPSLSGYFSIVMSEYYDIDTGAIVAVVFTEDIRIIDEIDFHREFWNYSEFNRTEFLPPGGLGFEPEHPDIGTSWHKNYSQYSYSSGTIQDTRFERHSNFTEHVKYTFLGFETITVPAGSYYASVLKGVYDDGTITKVWYSDTVNNFVKIMESFPEGDLLVISLVEYSRFSKNNPDGYTISPWNWVFFLFVGATVGAAIAAGIIVNRRSPKSITDLPSEERKRPNQDYPIKK
jgi:hypothetical protein